jgi:hypothetical protein
MWIALRGDVRGFTPVKFGILRGAASAMLTMIEPEKIIHHHRDVVVDGLVVSALAVAESTGCRRFPA